MARIALIVLTHLTLHLTSFRATLLALFRVALRISFCAAFCTSMTAVAETVVINGIEYECKDGLCAPVNEGTVPFNLGTVPITPTGTVPFNLGAVPITPTGTVPVDEITPTGTVPVDEIDNEVKTLVPSRISEGYMSAEDFVGFLKGTVPSDGDSWSGLSWGAILLLILVGGIALNLTPCVLPMIPVSLIVIGRSATKGAWYGLGMVVAYGMLGLLAAMGGLAFGEIQSNPWFNLVVAVVFVAMGLSLLGAFAVDLSRYRGKIRGGAFVMGMLSAVLAGACVAPILISVLMLTARLYAEGKALAVALPFVLGLGMALPWPLLGAGMSVLPRPGRWMLWINRVFAIFMLVLAGWYGKLAWQGIWGQSLQVEGGQSLQVEGGQSLQDEGGQSLLEAVPATLVETLAELPRPVLVDCWASWCKNCTAMESVVFPDPLVKKALGEGGYTVLRVRAEDLGELRAIPGFEAVHGLPAFAIFE